MTQTDFIGSIGVSLLLIAYFLNLKNVIQKDSLTYLALNLVGASMACLASVLLRYLPFIILEGCWAMVSAFGLFNYLGRKTKS